MKFAPGHKSLRFKSSRARRSRFFFKKKLYAARTRRLLSSISVSERSSLSSRFSPRFILPVRLGRKLRRHHRRRQRIYHIRRFFRRFPAQVKRRSRYRYELARRTGTYRFFRIALRMKRSRSFVKRRRLEVKKLLHVRLKFQRQFAKQFIDYLFRSGLFKFSSLLSFRKRVKIKRLSIKLFRLACLSPKVFYLPIWPKLWRKYFNRFSNHIPRSQFLSWFNFKTPRYSWFKSLSVPGSPGAKRFSRRRRFKIRLPIKPISKREKKRRMGKYARRALKNRLKAKRRIKNQRRRRALYRYLIAVKSYLYAFFLHPRDRVINFRFYRYKRYRKTPITKEQRTAWVNWAKKIIDAKRTNSRRFAQFDRWRFKSLIRKRFFSNRPLLWSRRLLYFYMHQTPNNFFYYILSRRRLLAHYSNGRTEFSGSRRRSSVACESAVKHVARAIRRTKLTRIFPIFPKRINFFTRTVLRILARNKIKIVGCRYRLKVPHGAAARKRASRRVLFFIFISVDRRGVKVTYLPWEQ